MDEHGEGIGLGDSCNPQAPYAYEALPNNRDIRLLSYRYLPDEDEVTIECSLVTTSLDDILSSGTKYQALSYVWGDPDDTVAITCDGKRLSITRNLHALLVNLFKTKETEKPGPSYFWADAICINQVDDEEKTLQVRLMQDIFSRADHVIAWLGEESRSVKRAFAFIRQEFATMSKYTLVDPETQEEYFDYDPLNPTEAEAVRLGLPERTDKVWGDLACVVSNTWFSRVWVVQEALMAKTLTFLCGTTTLPAEILFPFADHYMKTPTVGDALQSQTLAPWFLNSSYLGRLKSSLDRGKTLKMIEILYQTREFKASDARDKVFAMVGLAADIDDTFIDYSQKDPGPMLVRLAKHLLRILDEGAASCPALKMLGYAGGTTTTIDLPSWVFDWTSPRYLATPYCEIFRDGDEDDPTSSENERTCQFAQVTNTNSLLLRGRLLDHIESLVVGYTSVDFVMQLARELIDETWESGVTTQLVIENQFLTRFERFKIYIRTMQQLVDDLGPYPTGETLTDVLWRSFILDDECKEGSDYRNEWAKLLSMLRQCIELCHKHIFLLQNESPAKKQEALSLRQQAQELKQTEAEIRYFVKKFWTIDQCFSTTKRGYVGWTPKGASRGDELWLFHGGRVQFVLRPAADRQGDERAYRLIGDCYLHGLMRSKASARIAGETQQVRLV